MAHFNVKLSGLRTDSAKFTKDFDRRAQALMKKAAEAWLRAVILQVPLWTGFARGGLKFADGPNGNLSRFLHVAINVASSKKNPKWYYHPGRRRIPKKPEQAGRFAHYTFSASRHVFTFTYTTNIVHFLIEEFYGRQSGPWNSMEAGQKAWLLYFFTNKKKSLPDLVKYTYPIPGISITNGQLKILDAINFNEALNG